MQLTDILVRLFRHIDQRRRYQGALLLLLAVGSSAAEVISLGSLVPFIGILTSPDQAKASLIGRWTSHLLGITEARDLVLPLTVAFIAAAIVAGVLRVMLTRASIRLTNGMSVDLSVRV